MLKEDTEFSPHLLVSDLDLANRMLWLMTLKLKRAESGTQARMHAVHASPTVAMRPILVTFFYLISQISQTCFSLLSNIVG